MKRLKITMTAALCAITMAVSADLYYPLDGPLPPPLCKPVSFYDQFFVEGGLLVWQAYEEDMQYAVVSQPPPGSAFINNGQFRNLNKTWNVGFELGLGYRMPKKCYEFFLNWTHFNTSAKDSCAVASTGNIYSNWPLPFASSTGAKTASGKWKLDINLLTLEMATYFCPARCLKFRPHIGLIYANINQNLDVNLAGGTSGTITVADNANHFKNDFWGIGVRTGLGGTWNLCWGFSLYGDAAFSILYGKFHLNQNQVLTLVGLTPISVYDTHDRHSLPRCITELGIGVQWVSCLPNGLPIKLKLGWDSSYFFGQNQLKHFLSTVTPGSYVTTHGDLIAQGLTLKAKVDF